MKKTKKWKQKRVSAKRRRKALRRETRAGQNPYMFCYQFMGGVLRPFGARRRHY